MSKDGSLVCVRIAALAMLGLFGIAGPAAPAAAEPKSPTGGAQLCKEKCEKDCMGNDTPTERSNCLQREKCRDRAACPKDGAAAQTGRSWNRRHNETAQDLSDAESEYRRRLQQ